LTPGDVRRIAAATGLAPTAFTTSRRIDAVEAEALLEQDPVLKGLAQGGSLVSLAKAGRACVFHVSGRGCSLDYAVRPVLCRRYPIVRRGRYLTVQPGGDCLGVEESRDMPELLNAMGLTIDELERLDREIRGDLKS
jgi:Fe-S-cluster containining protein